MIGRLWALAIATLLALVVLLAVATSHADTRSPARARLVDGHGVKWWAARARDNGAAVRWQQKRINLLQDSIADRVDLAGGLTDAFVCIYHHEASTAGGWQANTGNGYFGGLQMDLDFQRAYGREFLAALGTADRWPPYIQVAVAARAYYSGRGFGPWPNTRRSCGL